MAKIEITDQWSSKAFVRGIRAFRNMLHALVGLLDDAHLQCGLVRNATLREMATLPQNTFAWASRNVKQNALDLCRVVLRQITTDIHDKQEQPNVQLRRDSSAPGGTDGH